MTRPSALSLRIPFRSAQAPYHATISVCGLTVNIPWSGIANTIARLRPSRLSFKFLRVGRQSGRGGARIAIGLTREFAVRAFASMERLLVSGCVGAKHSLILDVAMLNTSGMDPQYELQWHQQTAPPVFCAAHGARPLASACSNRVPSNVCLIPAALHVR
jgi:hypothetical protein